LLLLVRPPLASTHVPYTTLFRSVPEPRRGQHPDCQHEAALTRRDRRQRDLRSGDHVGEGTARDVDEVEQPGQLEPVTGPAAAVRSEEHTSELQSRENLVCRLLLE